MKSVLVVLTLIAAALTLRAEVVLEYEDPKTFKDFEYAQTRKLIEVEFFSKRVSGHLEKAAEKALPEGSKLILRFLDIDLAGGFEPWQSIPLDDVRMLKDRYPPEVKLAYQVEDNAGKVLVEGVESLRDRGYLDSGRTIRSSNDTFHHEWRMIERWIRVKLRKEVNKQLESK